MQDRLIIEPLRIDHAELLFEPLKDQRIYHYIPDRPYASVEALRARYAALLRGPRNPDTERWLNWVMFDRESLVPVGTLQATVLVQQGIAQVGYVVFAEHWQRGYGQAGLAWLVNHLRDPGEINRLEAYIDVANLASIKLIQKEGFRLDRTVDTDTGIDRVYIKDL